MWQRLQSCGDDVSLCDPYATEKHQGLDDRWWGLLVGVLELRSYSHDLSNLVLLGNRLVVGCVENGLKTFSVLGYLKRCLRSEDGGCSQKSVGMGRARRRNCGADIVEGSLDRVWWGSLVLFARPPPSRKCAQRPKGPAPGLYSYCTWTLPVPRHTWRLTCLCGFSPPG